MSGLGRPSERFTRGSFFCAAFLTVIAATLVGASRYAKAGADTRSETSAAHLTIWAPAGVIGGNYWLYINGRIASRPPHHSQRRTLAMTQTHRDDGYWILRSIDNVLLASTGDGEWDSKYTPYALSPAVRDALGFFEATNFSLPAGGYSVQLAALNGPGLGSDPFVFSRIFHVNLVSARTVQLFIPIPGDFYGDLGNPQARYRLCYFGSAPPSRNDIDRMSRVVSAYLADPIVTALRLARASLESQNSRTVVIDFPRDKGGSHEFDAAQVTQIIDTIASRYYVPSRSEVADCQRQFPENSSSYAAVGRLVDVLDSDLQTLRQMPSMMRSNH